ncbi:Leucine-rich repeat like protein [Argiope bruennichi]|uniref:Leucine-rich repeat like protein n=1 Tax=Argiope bruennichi TaxID=94029 RepID=A0A8T0FLD4_ARGBR|nr:Leucine-rich repeat like protein [Argiope bruennichi]
MGEGVPKSSIREAPDLYVKTGSSINLTCIISQSPEPPVFVFWYHNDRMINYDSSGGDISVHKAGQDTAISRLFIKNAQPSDSGNYTCCPSNADASSISVHVLNGLYTKNNRARTTRSKESERKKCFSSNRVCSVLFLYEREIEILKLIFF